MFPPKAAGSCAHPSDIERIWNMCCESCVKRTGFGMVKNCITIRFFNSIKPGMKLVVGFLNIPDGDVIRQICIHGAHQRVTGNGCCRIEMGHLSPGVDSAIGTAGSIDPD